MTQLSSAIHTLFSLWQSAFFKGTWIPYRLLKLGINVQVYFFFFLNSWTVSSFYVLQWFWLSGCLVQETSSSGHTNQANLSFHKMEMPISDQVNAFGKGHRNQSLRAQREVYLPGSLKKLKNQSRPCKNSQISMWGSMALTLRNWKKQRVRWSSN